MRCLDCGEQFVTKHGEIIEKRKNIGTFKVSNVEYLECERCGQKLYPAKTAKQVDRRGEEIQRRLIENLPVKDFIGATAAAKMIGISRQAMHKHPRIRRGFIYSVKLEGKIFYHLRSVNLYKEKGDGRFPLHIKDIETKFKIITNRVPSKHAPIYEKPFPDRELPTGQWRAKQGESVKNTIYLGKGYKKLRKRA
ncbi:MAG: hypothetical protein K9J83_01335 [Desulfarculaceae bacterium]|nr:hypothetical protein [Desulfarculaceae bacterium]